MTDRPAITRAETIEALLKASNRKIVPLRRAFLQTVKRTGGPLSTLVRNHDERGLDLYLLIIAAASAGDYDVRRPAAMWARALGNGSGGKLDPGAVSKVLARLEALILIARQRDHRQVRVTLLEESGSGAAYTRPGKDGNRDPYLRLPHSYWLDGWHEKLSPAGKALLLISLTLRPGFILPDRASEWYGISPETLYKGLHELEKFGLLSRHPRWRKEPLSAEGVALEVHYRLEGAFKRRPIMKVAGNVVEVDWGETTPINLAG